MIYELDGQTGRNPSRRPVLDCRDGGADRPRPHEEPVESIWFGAVLRGDNEWIEIGERSQIQDNATLHTDPGFPMVIGPNCVIGHNVMLQLRKPMWARTA